jgi:hypothetical protein
MTKGEKIEYERLIMKVISIGAFWVYPVQMECYLAVDFKKIQPMTNRGYRVLKGMVRKEFFNNYVLPPLYE